jgi:hypothetical protein
MRSQKQMDSMMCTRENPRLHLKDVDLRENYLKIIGVCG